ncbi:NTP transferase domain-containing protein [Neomegalonema sp.]|uniref:nucleotidyltransferase family protein n=1 Tax=Neomegalonema sp. TaxID=2039713 RepID=UPI002626F6AE|nr:NTP transferase domain-containing protein [Neomegalonema sp.]MDD2867450.1 NTP transferase domain-containing protein [Neomegalonema sp.]
MKPPFGVLLAAGASRRFGPEDKLLALWRGRPLVLRAAEAMREAGCGSLAAVVSSPGVEAVLPEGFAPLRIAPGLPMADSLRRAVLAAQEAGAGSLLICLGDMPGISGETLRRLISGAEGRTRACVRAGVRSPPALLASADFAAALRAEGDQGAREVLRGLAPEDLLALTPEEAADVDLPGDLALSQRPRL